MCGVIFQVFFYFSCFFLHINKLRINPKIEAMSLHLILSPWYSEFKTKQYFLFSDDEGGHIKQAGYESRRQNDLYMRLGLLLGERRGSRSKSRESCTSLASLDAHTLASHNTSPVSTYIFYLSYIVYLSEDWSSYYILRRDAQ